MFYVLYKSHHELLVNHFSTAEEVFEFKKNLDLKDTEYAVIEGTVKKDFDQNLNLLNGALVSFDIDKINKYNKDLLEGIKIRG